MKRVLVTGATGFIGRHCCAALTHQGYAVRAAVRDSQGYRSMHDAVDDVVVVGDIGESTDWSLALRSVDSIVHLAARAHITRDAGIASSVEFFHRVNALGTRRLADAAVRAGIRRFVHMSTIGVNGNTTRMQPFRATDAPRPTTPYAQSKLQAERELDVAASGSALEVVVVRPPLVYGPNVPGNFRKLLALIDSRIPLPLRSVKYNRRSLIGVHNLTAAIVRLLEHPRARGQTFVISDGEDVSTFDLINHCAGALGVTPVLFPVPRALALGLFRTMGKPQLSEQLWESLQVDPTPIRSEIGWAPVVPFAQGIQETAAWFKKIRRGR